MASQLGNLQNSALSGVGTAHSEAQSDASPGNADYVADSAASPLAAQSHISAVPATGAQPEGFPAQPVASVAETVLHHDVEPGSELS